MAKPNSNETDAITRGSGNVLADLGYPDAEERQTKLRLAHALNQIIARRRLTQAAAAERLGINQPKVSALANYKLDGFSVERLLTFLTALDRDIEIVIRKKPRSLPTARAASWRRDMSSKVVADAGLPHQFKSDAPSTSSKIGPGITRSDLLGSTRPTSRLWSAPTSGSWSGTPAACAPPAPSSSSTSARAKASRVADFITRMGGLAAPA